jgi:ectoine hydroxylase-related dioxygenase (phytanoyl-CoA dioxygenase family)
MRNICRALIGSTPHLVWEQFSVKNGAPATDTGAMFTSDGNPQSLGHFSWHQDSGYVPRDHPPYLSCWIALDDITAQNGPLFVLPFSELGVRTRVSHIPDPHNGDLVGYFGVTQGRMLEVTRGTVVCFSSALFHRSPRNGTASPRRAYLAQYAPSVYDAAGEILWHDAERFPQ